MRRGRDGVRGPSPGAARRGAAPRGADLLRAAGHGAPPRPATRGGGRARRQGLRRALLSGGRIRRAWKAEARRRRHAPRLRAAAVGGG